MRREPVGAATGAGLHDDLLDSVRRFINSAPAFHRDRRPDQLLTLQVMGYGAARSHLQGACSRRRPYLPTGTIKRTSRRDPVDPMAEGPDDGLQCLWPGLPRDESGH